MTAIMTDWTPERVNWDETNFEGPHPRRMSAAREKCGPHPYMDRPPVSLAWGCSQWRARATRLEWGRGESR